MYDTHMSTPGNTAKLGTANTGTYRQHKEVRPWLEANLQCISLQTTESALYPLCQPGIVGIKESKWLYMHSGRCMILIV